MHEQVSGRASQAWKHHTSETAVVDDWCVFGRTKQRNKRCKMSYRRSAARPATTCNLPYTFPGGLPANTFEIGSGSEVSHIQALKLPRIRLTMESLAMRMFLYAPRMWIFESATTMRVLVTFSIVNLVWPPLPAMRPMARERWSPWRGLTARQEKCAFEKQRSRMDERRIQMVEHVPSVTSKESMYRSSSRRRATAS